MLLCVVCVEDIADADYRRRLFAEPKLGTEASLVVRTREHAPCVNLCRGLDRQPLTSPR